MIDEGEGAGEEKAAAEGEAPADGEKTGVGSGDAKRIALADQPERKLPRMAVLAQQKDRERAGVDAIDLIHRPDSELGMPGRGGAGEKE